MLCSRTLCFVAASPLALALPISATAQSIWLEPHEDRAIQLEILKPQLDRVDLTFPSAAYFVSLRLATAGAITLVAELPVAYAEEETFGESDATVGSPYIGAEFELSDASFAELGVRIPITDAGPAATVGAVSDFVDRFEAFLDDVVSIHAGFNYRKTYDSGLSLRLRGAPVLDIPTADGDTELFVLYSAQVWYKVDRTSLGGGVSGRILTTEGEFDLGERTLHQLALAGSVELGRYRPGVQVRIPLDEDLRDILDLVVSFSLAFQLR